MLDDKNFSEEDVLDFFLGNLDFKKEQFNEKGKSLEAIGDVADDPDENQDSPMDQDPDENENPDDEGGEPTGEPADTDNDNPEDPEEPGNPDENQDDDEGGASPDEDPDPNQDEEDPEEDEETIVQSEAVDAFENRKQLISINIIKLYEAIVETIQNISDSASPSFNKPVILEELEELREECMLLNGELNKVQDHNIILSRYGVMVKSFDEIIARRIDRNEKTK